MPERQLNCLTDRFDLFIQATDVIKGHLRNFRSKKLLDILTNDPLIGKSGTSIDQDAFTGTQSSVAKRSCKFNDSMASSLR